MKPYIAIPATLVLVYRAYSRNSLTPVGIVTAALTAVAHAYHPWSIFFTLLCAFFLAGTFVTKVKHAQKAKLTVSSAGGNNPLVPHPRTAVQVLANSVVASVLCIIHARYFGGKDACLKTVEGATWMDLLPYGIFAQYAAVAADTFASELGILSGEKPVLITDVAALLSLKPTRVPRGTNGGVTAVGTLAGAAGAGLMGLVTLLVTPFCLNWSLNGMMVLALGITVWGTLGMLLDSVLGGVLQASVIDVRTGRVVEGDGGAKVQCSKTTDGTGQRKVVSGQDILDNNGVNFAMAASMSISAIVLLKLLS